MAGKIEWVIVTHGMTQKPIGAVGFIDNRYAVVGSFYSDKDLNQDGKVSISERLSTMVLSQEGRAVAEVAGHAQYMNEVIEKDPDGVSELASRSFMNYVRHMVAEATYNAYFKQSFSTALKAALGPVIKNGFAEFVVRKSLEREVKEIYVN